MKSTIFISFLLTKSHKNVTLYLKEGVVLQDRIKYLRKELNLTQQEFADKIGSKRNTVAKYEIGANSPSAAIITSICREFNVNKEWLLTGKGETFNKLTKSEQAAKAIGKILNTDDEIVLNTFIALAEMPESFWDDVKDFIDKIKTKNTED